MKRFAISKWGRDQIKKGILILSASLKASFLRRGVFQVGSDVCIEIFRGRPGLRFLDWATSVMSVWVECFRLLAV